MIHHHMDCIDHRLTTNFCVNFVLKKKSRWLYIFVDGMRYKIEIPNKSLIRIFIFFFK